MNKNEIIKFEELINILDNETVDSNFKSTADILLEAFTDWPTQGLEEPSEMISELKQEVKGELTFDNIQTFLKTLKPKNDAWKIESLSSLVKLFDFEQNENNEIDLEIIIDKLTKQYKTKSYC